MQVADFLENELQPRGVAVILQARHLCVEMRGIKKHNTTTTTNAMRGVFRDSHETCNKLFQLVAQK